MGKKEMKYSEALKEVEDILQTLEAEELEVDDISEKIKRAVTLIEVCRSKLEKSEVEVKKIVDAFEKAK
ncbi:MAG: exodeoxyribonuclease VII small subunit [Candidatus Omnitrophica bacterium]|nr:exodeoxyribonuclease VII small subunit [Candidatus Omnitrophota bacterium]MDD5081323.1 exodeoxyribonuclease VII small subunit [Candidatus Omnitrophota bacterium]MDD5440991.1 exodeoxyribonuclease VII small subunit [Candidatus Omnitrophota bacterium]